MAFKIEIGVEGRRQGPQRGHEGKMADMKGPGKKRIGMSKNLL